MRSVITFLFLLLMTTVRAQVSFEKFYNTFSFNSVVELSDGSFLLCGMDSNQYGNISRVDRYGNLFHSFTPMVRGDHMSIANIIDDPSSGGYAITGSSLDTSGNNATGYFVLMNALGQNTDSVFYSGGVDGPMGVSIVRTSTNDFIIATESWDGAGTYLTEAHKIIYPDSVSWDATGGSNISNNGLAIDENDNMLIAGFNWTGAASANLKLYNPAGSLTHTFQITDTAYGNSLVYQSYAGLGPEGNYLFGCDLSPGALNYGVPYINCLDTSFNILWEKYLDWGYGAGLVAMTGTNDNCIMWLLQTDSGLAMMKTNLNGDSLWTRFHNSSTTGSIVRFSECADGGFVMAGTYADSLLVMHGYILRTDSTGNVLLPVGLTVTGNATVCPGDSCVISAPPGYYYQWSNLETTQSITLSQPGAYAVMVTDSISSAVSDTFHFAHYNVITPVITFTGTYLVTTGHGSFQWYFYSNPIPNSDTSFCFPLAEGAYTVQVIDSNGCVTMSAPYIITGISEINNAPLIFETATHLSVISESLINEIMIYDLSGKLFFESYPQSRDFYLDKNIFPPGMYILTTKDNNNTLGKKKFVCY